MHKKLNEISLFLKTFMYCHDPGVFLGLWGVGDGVWNAPLGWVGTEFFRFWQLQKLFTLLDSRRCFFGEKTIANSDVLIKKDV